MTAVLSPTDILKRDRISVDDLSYSSSTDWRSKYEEVADMLSETRAELDEFHTASKELEAELESELQRTEKAQQDLKVKVARAENERDEWKSKFISLQTTHNSTTTSLQRELDKLRQDHQKLKVQFRELEMGNDDLERTERAVSSSLADVEAKYSRALEEKILLEHELLDKANVEEQLQRMKDELRDANSEVSILKDQLAARAASSSQASFDNRTSVRISSLPSDDDLLNTPAPSDLQLSELETSDGPVETPPTSSEDQEVTPRKSAITTTPRSTGQSALLQRAGFQPGKPLATPPSGSSIPRSSTLPSLYSTSPRTPITPLQRPTVNRNTSVVSNSSTTSTNTTRSKGVQMVSEMRARVKNLEQKIHTRVPRLRLGSMTNRTGIPNSALSPTPQSPSTRTLLGRSSIEKPTRRSNDSKRSTDGEGESKKDNGDSSGWVLIMEDSPSPPRARRTSRSGVSRASTSTASSSSSPTPDSSKSSLFQSTVGGLRRPQSRLSSGTSTTGTSIPTPISRPTTPTFLPIPSSSSGLPLGKRSTGPGAANYLSQPKRSSLGASTSTTTTVRERPLTMPPFGRPTSPSKALPRLPNGHQNVTVRNSKVSPSASSSHLARSRIGRPSGGSAQRRSSVDGAGSGSDTARPPRAVSAVGP